MKDMIREMSSSGANRAVDECTLKSLEHYKDFVTRAYARYLSRLPDDQGFAYWVGLMQLYETSHHTQGLRQEPWTARREQTTERTARWSWRCSSTWVTTGCAAWRWVRPTASAAA